MLEQPHSFGHNVVPHLISHCEATPDRFCAGLCDLLSSRFSFVAADTRQVLSVSNATYIHAPARHASEKERRPVQAGHHPKKAADTRQVLAVSKATYTHAQAQDDGLYTDLAQKNHSHRRSPGGDTRAVVKHASGVSTPNGDTRIVTSCVPSAHTHCRRDETRDTARQVASSTRGVIQRLGGLGARMRAR